jgi:hypothetical protein
VVGQNLQRHVAAELGVARAIDLAHAPGADRRLNVIWTDAWCRKEGPCQLVRRWSNFRSVTVHGSLTSVGPWHES